MPAQRRLAEQVMEQAKKVAEITNTPDAWVLAEMTTNLFYGNELGLAFLNRGAEGVRARQLLRDYEEMQSWLNSKRQSARI